MPGLGSGRGGFGTGEADEGAGTAEIEGTADAVVGGGPDASPVQPATAKAQVTVRVMASGKRTARC
ncbi:hypothetical protein Aau02nite_76360 [Amorphoplanes auranticolor]|uniref:Uncharacterized protein n=1 Tax=Actinoplanes auranticolor TaxID=47988 RepID=A0A919SU95_9ACTN|nr:hypothetical protein Aau02nite_76360 [Actinoplanes auranticolor]